MTWRRRLSIASVLTAFEAGMPGVGMMLSGPVGHMIGSTAHYFAALLLIGIGVFMLLADDEDEDEAVLATSTLIAVGFAVSVDEVAVGVSLGLHGVAFAPLALTIALWVGAATMTGLTLGARVPARFHEVAEVAAAVALIVLGIGIGCGVL